MLTAKDVIMLTDYYPGLINKSFWWFCQTVISGLILTVITIGIATAQTVQPKEIEDSTAVVEKFYTKLLEAMKGGKKIGYAGRHTILEPVIREVFAFNIIVRISSGKYWQTLTTEQRERLIELYRQWSTAVYARQYDSFNGQCFKVTLPEKPWGNSVNVDARMIKKSGDEVSFLYKLIKVKGRWQIVDIHVKGISQLAMMRAQFISIMEHDGFDGLEKELLEKTEALLR